MAIWKTIVRIIWNGWNKMKKEYWKPVVGYEGLYEVSNWGRVKSMNYNHTGKEKILKPGTNNRGYLYVVLWKNNKQKHFLIHRLVAEAFLEIPEELKQYIGTVYLQVNHKDENKKNNNVENLEFCDRTYNVNYGTRNERIALTKSKPVLQYDLERNFIREWPSTMECGRNGFNQGAVAACCRGELKTYKGFIWKYK